MLKPLPTELFETGRLFTPRVDRYSQIAVQTNRHSVPVRLIGRTVRVMLHANHLVVYDQGIEVARHERLSAKASSRLELDHYLEVLIRKPGAFPGAAALEQARSQGSSRRFMTTGGPLLGRPTETRTATRALIEVLLLGRHMSHEHIVAGLATALRAGAFTADAVALEARKAAEADEPAAPAPARGPLPEPPGRRATVTFLADWRMSHLPTDTRALPSVAPYDQLLRHRRQAGDTVSQGEAP